MSEAMAIELCGVAPTTLFWKNMLSFSPFVRLREFLIGMLAGRIVVVGGREQRPAPALVWGGLFEIAIATILQPGH
jgi:hypothetical protein